VAVTQQGPDYEKKAAQRVAIPRRDTKSKPYQNLQTIWSSATNCRIVIVNQKHCNSAGLL